MWTLSPDDVVASGLMHRDRNGKKCLMQNNPNQHSYCMPEIRGDGVQLLKCYEPARDGHAVLSLYGALENPIVPADVLLSESIGLQTNAFHSVVACVD